MSSTLRVPLYAVVCLALVVVSSDESKAEEPVAATTADDSTAVNPVESVSQPTDNAADLRAVVEELRALRADLKRVEERLDKAPDKPDEIVDECAVFQLESAVADEIVEAVYTLRPEARVAVLPGENKLLVVAQPKHLKLVKQLIDTLDQPRRQVRISAHVYDVDVEKLKSLNLHVHRTGTGTRTETGTDFAVTTRAHMGDADALLAALSERGGAQLLARPTIIATDRIEAVFEAVNEVPVQQLTQTAEGGNIGTTEFREVGISLRVTPRITHDGSIVLEASPTHSVLHGFESGQPIIDRRQATTTMKMNDGDTVVFGGLRRRSERRSPGSFRRSSVKETELLVCLKAEIVNTDEVAERSLPVIFR